VPTTTNSLEATHRHLNEAVTGGNPFQESWVLLVEAIFDKTLNYIEAALYDFQYAVKHSGRRAENVPADQTVDECLFIGFTAEHCSCGETTLVSAFFCANLPCSYHYGLGAGKPRIAATLKIQISTTTRTLEYDETLRGELMIPYLQKACPGPVTRKTKRLCGNLSTPASELTEHRH
jgi:hypothetical protein